MTQTYVRGEIEADITGEEALEEILKRTPRTLMGDGGFILSLIEECRVCFFEDGNDIDTGFNLHISTPLNEEDRRRPFEVKSLPSVIEKIFNYADSRLFSHPSFVLELLNSLKVRIGPLDYSQVETVDDWSVSVSGCCMEFMDA